MDGRFSAMNSIEPALIAPFLRPISAFKRSSHRIEIHFRLPQLAYRAFLLPPLVNDRREVRGRSLVLPVVGQLPTALMLPRFAGFDNSQIVASERSLFGARP